MGIETLSTISTKKSPNWKNEAFCLEIKEKITPQSFEKLVTSYLGEYRFQLPLYQYSYLFDPNQGLIDPNTREPMIEKAQRAIERRIGEYKSTVREEAELIGLQKIYELLANNLTIGTGIVWASPPGDKNNGYGDYGFIFYGVVDGYKNGQWHITMNARRVEDGRDIEKFNQVLSLLTNQAAGFRKDVDFLRNPMLLGDQVVDVESIISQVFNPIDRQTQEIFNQALGNNGVLKPLINEAVRAYLSGNSEEFLKLMIALENISHKLKTGEIFISDNSILEKFANSPWGKPNYIVYNLNSTDEDYGLIALANNHSNHLPPMVAGSCGSTLSFLNRFNTNNVWERLLRLDLITQSDRYEDYQCPNCGQTIQGELKDKPETWKTCCPHCGYEFNCGKK